MEPLLAASESANKVVSGYHHASGFWSFLNEDFIYLEHHDLCQQTFNDKLTIPDLVAKITVHVEAGFADTRVPSDFTKSIVQPVTEIICNHSVLVLGQTGSGKSSLINRLSKIDERHVGPFQYDRTRGAAAVDISLDGLDGVNLFLVDTEGWTFKQSSEIRQGYEQVLQERKLATGHLPHIILFCIQADGLKNWTDDCVGEMQRTLASWMQSRKFPIRVLPVATFIDTVSMATADRVKEEVLKICHRVFGVVGASVHGQVIAVACKELEPDEEWLYEESKEDVCGFDDLRFAIQQTVQKHVQSREFKDFWLRKLANMLLKKTRDYAHHNPAEESEWRLFLAAVDIVASSCDKVCEKPEGRQINRNKEPPWWIIDQIPLPKTQRKKCPLPVYWHALSNARQPWIVPMLLLMILFMWQPWNLAGTAASTAAVSRVHNRSSATNTSANMAWVLGERFGSCYRVCEHVGLFCANNIPGPSNKEEFMTIIKSSGAPASMCQSYKVGSLLDNPSCSSHDADSCEECWYMTKGERIRCGTHSVTRRFCPCLSKRSKRLRE